MSRKLRKQNKKEERKRKIVKFFQTVNLVLGLVNGLITLIRNLKN